MMSIDVSRKDARFLVLGWVNQIPLDFHPPVV